MTVLDTAIVGGGLAGMTIAATLHQQGISAEVFEKSERAGGKVRSIREDGFIVEMGPLGWLDREPAVSALVRSLGLTPMPASKAAGRRALLIDGQLQPMPTGFLSFLGSPILSIGAKVRLLAEPFVGRGDSAEESVHSFATRRFGSGVADTFIAAMVSGIFGGDPHRLSAQAAFPLMASWEAEAGSCIRGAVRHMRRRRREQRAGTIERTSGQLLTLEGGFTDLIDAIHEKLGDTFRGATAPDAVVRDDGEWVLLKNGHELARSRQLVMALHAREAIQLLHEAPGTETERVAFQQARAAAEGISNAPLAVVTTAHCAKDVRGAIDGFGFIALRNKSFRPLGVQFASSIFPSQSPFGHVQLRTLLGGVSDPEAVELDDPQLLDAALAPVQDVLHIENTPSHTWIQRVREGIPQYDIGHIGRVHAMERFAETMPSLYFVGDSLHGVGINKVIARAHEVALTLLSHRGQSGAGSPH